MIIIIDYILINILNILFLGVMKERVIYMTWPNELPISSDGEDRAFRMFEKLKQFECL